MAKKIVSTEEGLADLNKETSAQSVTLNSIRAKLEQLTITAGKLEVTGISGGTGGGSGDASAANQLAGNTTLSSINTKITTTVNGLKIDGSAVTQPISGTVAISGTVPVSGTFFPATQAVSGSISVSNLPATQPVSGSVSISNFPATQTISGTVSTGLTQPLTDSQLRATALPISGSVSVSNFPATQAVTGTFYQATQPISGTVTISNPTAQGLTDSQLRASPLPISGSITATNPSVALAGAVLPTSVTTIAGSDGLLAKTISVDTSGRPNVNVNGTVPVSGTFYQATQPVSGSVSVSNFPATQAVSGTISTGLSQPLTDAQLRATSLPVTVGNFPATQPISGTVTVLNPTAQGLTDAQLRATALPVSGSVSVSNFPASQTVTGTFFQATQPVSGSISVSNFPATQPVSGTVVVTQAAITKGTQGTTGVSTQDLKDAGRNQTNYFMATQIVSTASDALMSLTGYKGGAAVAATTTPAVVTAAKTYRITSITMEYTTIVTTPGGVRFTLRANTGGVVAITSPAVSCWEVAEPDGPAPVAGKKNTVHLAFPEGMEFPAGTGIGISMVGLSAVGGGAVVGYGRITITGFEY